MKKPHADSIGYRIRKAREDLGVSQKEFAQLIGVTKNYVGVIERGDEGKEPSTDLITKIAEVTGKRYLWLLTGKEDIDPIEEGIEISDAAWERIDIRLLLALLGIYSSDISKADIAEMLRVSVDDIEKILRGESVPFDQNWNSVLPGLAMRLDMPSLYEKVRTMTEVWITSQAKEHYDIVMYAMEHLISGTWGGNISWVQDEERLVSQSRDTPVRIKRREFRGKESPYARWTCIHIPRAPKMLFRVNEIVRDILVDAKTQREYDEITFAVADFSQYELYREALSSVLALIDGINCKVSVAYVDPDQRYVDYIERLSG